MTAPKKKKLIMHSDGILRYNHKLFNGVVISIHPDCFALTCLKYNGTGTVYIADIKDQENMFLLAKLNSKMRSKKLGKPEYVDISKQVKRTKGAFYEK